MKKYLIIILILILFASPVLAATNVYSVDLEDGDAGASNYQSYLAIADGDQTGLFLETALTITAWVKFENLADLLTIASKHQSGGTDSFGYAIRLRTGGTPTYRLNFIAGETAATQNHSYVDWDLSAGTWYHVAVTYDGGANEVKFYVNGSQLGATQSNPTNTINDSVAPFAIGVTWHGSLGAVNFFDGQIDELTVWNDVRTSTEISDEYNSGNGVVYTGSESGLVGYWRLENNGTDETSNSNDLTAYNNPLYPTDVPWSGSTPPAVVPKRTSLIMF